MGLKPAILLVAALTCGFLISGQPSGKALLVHSRYDNKDSTNEYLVAYLFFNGRFQKQDTILHTFRYPGSNTDGRISVGMGYEPIFFNRYLFTSIGLLIDLQEKKVLRDINGDFWRREGHKLYFSSRYHLDKVELFEYDLIKRSYRRVKILPFENNKHLVAPDLNHALKTEYASAGKTRLSVINAKGRTIPNTYAILTTPLLHMGTHARGKNPMLWRDSTHLLYLNYRIDNNGGWSFSRSTTGAEEYIIQKPDKDTLPCCTGLLMEMNINTGQKKQIAEIPRLYAPEVDDRLILLDSTVVLINYGHDTARRLSIHPVTGAVNTWQPGTQGSFQLIRNTEKDTVFGVNSVRITASEWPLNKYFTIQEHHSLDDHLAVYGTPQEQQGNDYGLWTWTAANGQWTRLNTGNFLQLFGWIDLNAQQRAPAPAAKTPPQKTLMPAKTSPGLN